MDGKRVVLVVEDEELVRVCTRVLGATCRVLEAGTLEDAARMLGEGAVDVCLCDINGVAELPRARRLSRNTEFVILTGLGGVSEAVRAVKDGAYDFLTRPFEPIERVAMTIGKAIERKELRDRADQLESERAQRNGLDRVKPAATGMPKYQEARERALLDFDRAYVAALLRMTQGNMAGAAAIAGLDRSNFRKVVVRAGIDFREFLPERLR